MPENYYSSNSHLIGQASVFSISGTNQLKKEAPTGSLGSRDYKHLSREEIFSIYDDKQNNVGYISRRYNSGGYNYNKEINMSNNNLKRYPGERSVESHIRASYVPKETPLTGSGLMYSDGGRPFQRQSEIGQSFTNEGFQTDRIDSSPIYSK